MSISIVLWDSKWISSAAYTSIYLFNNSILSAKSRPCHQKLSLHRFVPLRFIVASVKTNLIRIFLSVVVAATANGYHLCVCSVRKVLPRKIETKESSVYECKKWFRIIPREVIVSVLVAENDAVSTANRSGAISKTSVFCHWIIRRQVFDSWIKYFQWIFISVFALFASSPRAL